MILTTTHTWDSNVKLVQDLKYRQEPSRICSANRVHVRVRLILVITSFGLLVNDPPLMLIFSPAFQRLVCFDVRWHADWLVLVDHVWSRLLDVFAVIHVTQRHMTTRRKRSFPLSALSENHHTLAWTHQFTYISKQLPDYCSSSSNRWQPMKQLASAMLCEC